MSETDQLVQLQQQLVLHKDGFVDLVYEEGTLLRVLLISNDHVVVKDENQHTFILDNKNQNTLWSFL